MSQMPTWDEFLVHVLRHLSDGAIRSLSDVRNGAADLAELTADQRAEQLPSGQLRANNRVGWAVTHLNRVAAIERPSRGQYRITSKGVDLLSTHPVVITEGDLRAIAAPGDTWFGGTPAGPLAGEEAVPEMRLLDPLEQIEDGLKRVHASVAADLLQRMQDKEPAFFESAVVKLLVAMGYGGADGKAAVTQQSNDGGIDGIIDRDALGLDRIYIQAKRYSDTNSVQAPAVQGFVGALSGKASSGVFITTGSFSKGAVAYANTAHTRIILIDGRRLTDLMIRYGVGVQVRQVLKVVAVDEDFFE